MGLILSKKEPIAAKITFGGGILASILSLVLPIMVLVTKHSLILSLPWNRLLGDFVLEIDPLSSLFLILIALLYIPAAIYGRDYISKWFGKKSIGASCFFFNLLPLSMMFVVMARTSLLFIIAWEVMSVASFFLVSFENEDKRVQRSGLIYLITTNVATLFLIPFFILMGSDNNFINFHPLSNSFVFLLAIIAFGIKSGLIPFHIWVFKAYSVAPIHVAVFMSAAMIKIGFYGILRTFTFINEPPVWWGTFLIVLGLVSALLGILMTLVQKDIKKFLAYSSIENMGIITLALGIALLGQSLNVTILMVLGTLGALYHIINHAFIKGLLFLGAGSVIENCKINNLNLMGGLIKKMPKTAFFFLIGSLAILGAPILNGFVSEFFIYLGAFQGSVLKSASCILTLVVLPMVAALVLLAFAGAFSMIFLGHPRSPQIQEAFEAKKSALFSMGYLAIGCVVLGLGAVFIVPIISEIIPTIFFTSEKTTQALSLNIVNILYYILAYSFILISLIAIFYFLRRRVLIKRKVDSTITWDCGFIKPSFRMQYSYSSFSEMFVDFWQKILVRIYYQSSDGIFVKSITFTSTGFDFVNKKIFQPAFEIFSFILLKLKFLQQGKVQIYILYIFMTLLFLLIWKLW
ncbi:MAG: hypothetical protein HZB76_02290 [Chlamydiae bacterium]|nr:hypothetical protein [Chlamydiota bacterium]